MKYIWIAIALILFPARALAPQTLFVVENEFVEAWKEWKPLREAAVLNPNILDTKEIRAWNHVRDKWRALDLYMKNQH